MADYPPRREVGPPSGSYPPRYDPGQRSGYQEVDRRRDEAPRYRDDPVGTSNFREERDFTGASQFRDDRAPIDVAPSRHSVRVDFNDFERGGYRSPSPPGRREQRSRSPGRSYADRFRGVSPSRDQVRRDRSPFDAAPSAWDPYGQPPRQQQQPLRVSPPRQQQQLRLSPIPIKRQRSPSPIPDPRYVRRDYPANPSVDPLAHPTSHSGYGGRGLSPVRARSPIERFRENIPDRRPVSPGVRRPVSPRYSPPRRMASPPRYPPRVDDQRDQRGHQQSAMDRESLSLARSSNMATKTTTATIKEYINDFSGILELAQDPLDRSIPPTAFFHASATWIVNRSGNPYAGPVKYLDVLGANVSPTDVGVSLQREMPVGSKVCLTAKQVDSPFVNFVALQIWPLTTEPPPSDEMNSQGVLIEKKQDHYLREFHNALQDAKAAHSIVQATFPIFPWQGSGPDSAATVWQIKDENYGVIEVKGSIPEPFRFFALFHREHVWLKDGKRGADVEFFRGKPLSSMVQTGQQVTLSARSIVMTSGVELRPSILELQAIIVSLNIGQIPPSSQRPTMCLGGTGAYGMGAKASWYYFQQDLSNTLNKYLSTYLKLYQKNYPDLHPACLTYVEPKKKSGAAAGPAAAGPGQAVSGGKLPMKLINAMAQVKEHPNSDCFVVENQERTLRCLVSAARTFCSGGRRSDMDLVFPMSSDVHFNALLVDEKNPIQYVATLAWSDRDVQPSLAEIESRDQPANGDLLKMYNAYNFHLNKKKAPVPSIKTSSVYFEAKEATVLKLLDENFGVLKADQKMVLFDTCDVWLDPVTSVDKVGKKLIDVVSAGSVVLFHGALIDDSASIQYLASSVWLKKDDHIFGQRRPAVIRKENIHQEKIDIYKLVVKSVGNTLGVPRNDPPSATSVRGPSLQREEKWDKDITYAYNGIIKCIFYDSSYKDHQHILGGILATQENRSFAFFLTKHSLIYSSIPTIGAKVKFNLKPIRAKNRWTEQVPFVAVSLFELGHVLEDERECEKKFDFAQKKMIELMDNPAAVTALAQLKNGGIAGLVDVSPDSLASGALKIHDEVPFAILKCMLDERSGILESKFDSKCLCYFEIEDVTVQQPVDFKDLVSMMKGLEGVRIRYQAKMINDKSNIQYVAHAEGVQILGNLPPQFAHIKMKHDENFKSEQPVGLRSEKLNRYRAAEENFNRGEFFSISSILDGSYKRKPDHVCARGVVRHVLNENFGLVYGPTNTDGKKTYCLFDTFDLYLSAELTAADAGRSVESVVPVGTEVIFNACFIDGDKPVPYLATSLWDAKNTLINPPLPALPKESIQEDKLNIFVQVADSCAAIVGDVKPAADVRRSESRSKEVESRRSDPRRDDIDKVYQSENYKMYIKRMPKHRRGSRDPKTPDRKSSMSSAAWNDKISNWKSDLYRWNKKRADTPTSRIKDTIVKNDLMDHQMSGTLLKEFNSKFAILELSNGSKALVAHTRVWINDKPLYGDWHCLKTAFFRQINVNARKWKGPHGVEYQVTFCHSGMNKVDFKTKAFLYTGAMKSWLTPLLNVQQLDAEAEEFQTIAGKK